MIKSVKRFWWTGIAALGAFVLWTMLVQRVDVHPAGETGTNVGFAALNVWFHRLTGVHMGLYTLTDWLGLVPVVVCLLFGGVGLVQLLQRKSLRKVDPDILLLGIYYLLVVACYLVFEAVPINYRPVLIQGRMEASYPSSTTLLVLGVMPTLAFQARRRLKNRKTQRVVGAVAAAFSLFMVVGRTVTGVHWITDIIGSVLLGTGLFALYRAAVGSLGQKQD